MEVTNHATEFSGLPNFTKKGTICLTNCSYPVVHEVAQAFGLDVVQYTENWDLCWCDAPMSIKMVKEFKKYQKTNHFLGVSEISRKDLLARNLNTMMKYFENDYNFSPRTWYLPFDYSKLNAYMNKNKNSTYILKPSAGSRGNGIYLCKSMETINKYDVMICQLYITNPLLIDGFKFDMRVYVLLTSCDPLKIFVYNEGIVRLATEPYKKPFKDNLKNIFMHLTNYSVNKINENYVDNEISGSKRRITTLNKSLVDKGFDVKKIWDAIDDAIIKTVILAYPFLNRNYKTCFTGHKSIPACFEILGFDFLLDDKCVPHLLEVNHSPDLNTHTKLDKMVKRELLTDTFKLLQLDKTFKKMIYLEQKWKTEHLLNADKSIYQQKVIEFQKKFKQYNDAWENNNMGNYRLVYSKENEIQYEHFFYRNEGALYGNTRRTLLPLEEPVIRPQRKLGVKSTKSQKPVFKPTLLSTKPLKKRIYLQKSIVNHIKRITDSVNLSRKSNNKKSIIAKKRIKLKTSILDANKFFIKSIHKTALNIKLSTSIPNTSFRRKRMISTEKPAPSEANQTSEDIDSDCRKKIEMIKKMNQKKFPNVTSRLFDSFTVKKECFSNGWKETLIDQIEENTRLAYMASRAELIFRLGIKENIYNEFMKLKNLRKLDLVDYEIYQKKKGYLQTLHVTVIE